MTLHLVNMQGRYLERPLTLDQFLGREPTMARIGKADAIAGVLDKIERLRKRGKLKTAAQIEARMAKG